MLLVLQSLNVIQGFGGGGGGIYKQRSSRVYGVFQFFYYFIVQVEYRFFLCSMVKVLVDRSLFWLVKQMCIENIVRVRMIFVFILYYVFISQLKRFQRIVFLNSKKYIKGFLDQVVYKLRVKICILKIFGIVLYVRNDDMS